MTSLGEVPSTDTQLLDERVYDTLKTISGFAYVPFGNLLETLRVELAELLPEDQDKAYWAIECSFHRLLRSCKLLPATPTSQMRLA
jgi:hypothetical protein